MEKKTKYILIGLGVVAVGTGAYIFYQQRKKKQANTQRDFESAINNNTLPLPTTTSLPSKPSSSGSSSSGFPLKKGSKGTLVTSLQKALIKKYGASILPKWGADGFFGSETVNALISKGLPTSVDSDTFTSIVLSSGSSSGSSNAPDVLADDTASAISNKLHKGIAAKDGGIVLPALRKIRDVNHYKEVSTIFKQTKIGWVSKTIVTALLDAFKLASNRKKINEQFYRIGLKYDGSKWSLSGFLGVIDQLVTIQPTYVWNDAGHKLQVPKDTILGEYLDANNGVTEFETLDGRRLFVNTNQIRYAQ